MRRSAKTLLLTLALAIGQPSFADTTESGVADAVRDRARKLAMVTPHGKEQKKQSKTDSLVIGGGWRPQIPQSITIKIPRDVGEAADVCVVTARKLAMSAQKNAGDVCKWLASFWKQMHSPPTVTPAGAPYLSSQPMPATAAKLYFTQEGRLKTVVHR